MCPLHALNVIGKTDAVRHRVGIMAHYSSSTWNKRKLVGASLKDVIFLWSALVLLLETECGQCRSLVLTWQYLVRSFQTQPNFEMAGVPATYQLSWYRTHIKTPKQVAGCS